VPVRSCPQVPQSTHRGEILAQASEENKRRTSSSAPGPASSGRERKSRPGAKGLAQAADTCGNRRRGKPVARQGRKARGLARVDEIARLPALLAKPPSRGVRNE